MDDDADDDDVWVTIRYDHMAADLPAASGRFQSLLNGALTIDCDRIILSS